MTCDRAFKPLPAFEETDCPVDIARSLMSIASESSCGRCVYCREGTNQTALILEDVALGKGQDGDYELLVELLTDTAMLSGCEMSQKAAKESLDLLVSQEEIFSQHLLRKRCKNLVCRGCFTLHALPAICQGCGACAAICPKGAIKGGDGLIHIIDQELCDRCLKCVSACPSQAIAKAGAVKPECPTDPVPVGSFASGGKRRKRRG